MAYPLKLYRLRCGKKVHSPWLADLDQVWQRAFAAGLAFEGRDGTGGLGPLTWIEAGERARAKVKTISLGRLKG